MGLKFLLRLQVIPFCFHVSEIICDRFQPIKVIRSDGEVEIYDRPVNAAEVMSLAPKHLVCRSDSFYIGRRIPSLSSDDVLLPGDEYFLLPQQFFADDLSFVGAARMLLRRNLPFDVQRCPDGAVRVRVSVPRAAAPTDDEDEVGLCTTKQLKKDYSKLVGSTRQWKPKLETIKEEKKKRKISYTSSFKFRTCKSIKTSPDTNKEDAAGEEKEKENNDTNFFIDDNALKTKSLGWVN